MRSPVMLFRPGSETIIWDIHLDTIIVDEREVPDYLASGWYSHPFEARDSISAVKLETVSIADDPRLKAIADAERQVAEIAARREARNERLGLSIEPARHDAGIAHIDATPSLTKRRGRPPKAKE